MPTLAVRFRGIIRQEFDLDTALKRHPVVLVVDESSMVPIELFSWLLECLRRASLLRKVVLLGDVHQLPSIAPGNFMADLFVALEPRGLALRLLTNHRSEGSLIFDNAARLIRREMPIFSMVPVFFTASFAPRMFTSWACAAALLSAAATAFWQAAETFDLFFSRHSSAGAPPVGTPAQTFG